MALRDADFAFENNYPEDMHHKLYERIGRCHLALGQPDLAKESLQKAIVNLEQFAPKGERMKAKLKSLQTLVKECDESNEDGEKSTAPNRSEKYLENLLPALPNPHPKFPALSDAVEVRYGFNFCSFRPLRIAVQPTPSFNLTPRVILSQFLKRVLCRLKLSPVRKIPI